MKLPVVFRYAAYGLVFGFMLSRMGFSNFEQVHRMFLFEDLRLFLTFCTGVGLSALGFALLSKKSDFPVRPFHPGTVIGGALFGVGWALTGACPSILLVQIGEGRIAALLTLLGAVAGMLVYPAVHRRFFAWNQGTCNN